MRKLLFPVALIIGVSLPIAAAFADKKANEVKIDAIFETYDTDKDGSISWTELRTVNKDWEAARAARRKNRDDATGTSAPAPTGSPSPTGARPSPTGESKSGAVAPDMSRFKERLGEEMYVIADRDDDLKLTREELVAALNADEIERLDWVTDKDCQNIAEGVADQNWPRMLENKDGDKDGALSRDEMVGGSKGEKAQKQFDESDTNKDGKVDKAEYTKMLAADMKREIADDKARKMAKRAGGGKTTGSAAPSPSGSPSPMPSPYDPSATK